MNEIIFLHISNTVQSSVHESFFSTEPEDISQSSHKLL